jgi:tRNA(Ile)-lysidine synthetase-like protein
MIPGTTEIGYGWSLMASLTPWEKPGLRLAIPEGPTVIIRGRRNGDRFAPLGLNGHVQKLSKWFIDHGLAHELRDQLPLLVVNGEIAALFIWTEWVISHHFAVQSDSARVIYFRLNKGHS